MSEGLANSGVDQISALLIAKGLRSVALVDDIYDPLDQMDLRPDERDELWTSLEADEEALADLELIGHQVSGAYELTGAVLATFDVRREECAAFERVWQASLVGRRIEGARGAGARLTRLLDHDLGLEVLKFGLSTPIDELLNQKPQLVFLDWLLGEGDKESAIDAAVQKADELLKNWPGEQPKPVIVLMSTSENVLDEAEDFRKRSGLLAGAFYAVTKRTLTDPFSLRMHLYMFAVSLLAGHRVQSFVDALSTQIYEVARTFVDHVRELTLTDYAYIQRLSLQEDGHPLGDYLLWLFSAYFGHLLSEKSMRGVRADLDSMRFEQALPSQGVPSLRLTQIYQAALFDMDMEPIHAHPRGPSARKSSPDETIEEPVLRLGDVFRRVERMDRVSTGNVATETEDATPTDAAAIPSSGDGQESRESGDNAAAGAAAEPLAGTNQPFPGEADKRPDMYMIINAQCDLAFAPDSARRIEKDRSILLIPGMLQPIEQQITARSALRTELFSEGEQRYRILWQPKELKAVPYAQFHQWTKQQNLEPCAHLRMPFALEVQQAFASDLTRVGLPVAPPIYQPVDVQLLRPQGGALVSIEGGGEQQAFVILTRNGPRCVFTLQLVGAVRAALNARRDELARNNEQNDRATEEQKRAYQRGSQKISTLDQVLAAYEAWTQLLDEIELPGTSPRPLFQPQWLVKLSKGKFAGDSARDDDPVVFVNLTGI